MKATANRRLNTAQPTRGQGARAAFTLVELLTIMILIGLLAAILLPTLLSSPIAIYVARGLAQRKNLEDGADNYQQDHRGFYPGQEDPSQLDSYTGSQILAACLFDYNVTAPNPGPTGKYAAFKEGFLTNLNGRDRTLSDMFPRGKELAFCYYPYRGGTVGTPAYEYDHNDVYTSNAGGDLTTFSSFVIDPRFNQPRNKGRFILVAPGADRKYFTEDDIRNW